jgi:hypothetical protein
MLNRRPEVETLLAAGDNRSEVMHRVLTWLSEGYNDEGGSL